MFNGPLPLRRAGAVGAHGLGFSLDADDLFPAGRTNRRHFINRTGKMGLILHRTNHLRDDVARLLNHHGIAHANVLFPDIVDVVQSGPADR